MSPTLGLHPALWKLLRMRALGRVTGMVQGFSNPRRLLISILGAVLAFVWLGNAILAILFREQYAPEAFRSWLSLMLTGYGLWHFVRAAWQRPEAAIEWTDAERNNLMASPFPRDQLVQYRLMSVLSATTLKATIGTILFLPDLKYAALGFVGLWLALTFVELIRLTVDAWTTGLSDRAYRLFKTVAIGTAIALGAILFLNAVELMRAASENSHLPIMFLFFRGVGTVLRQMIESPEGMFVAAPFAPFVHLVTVGTLSWQTPVFGILSVLFVIGVAATLIFLDAWSERQQHQRQKQVAEASQTLSTRRGSQADAPVTPHPRDSEFFLSPACFSWCGGAVVWRQVVAAARQGTSILLALAPPAVLAAMPLAMHRLSHDVAFGNFLGGLTFYTFLLLPAALKYDFRRDYDRLLLLKMLPVSPVRLVLGQLATPVIITTLFQCTMVLFGYLVRPVDPLLVLAAVLAFPPLNLAIYGWENLFFLIFPQRLKQEGIEVFLRTTVVFTAKGITFALLLVFVVFWSWSANAIAVGIGETVPIVGDRRIVFGIGIWVATALGAVLMVRLAARQFKALDAFPSTTNAT